MSPRLLTPLTTKPKRTDNGILLGILSPSVKNTPGGTRKKRLSFSVFNGVKLIPPRPSSPEQQALVQKQIKQQKHDAELRRQQEQQILLQNAITDTNTSSSSFTVANSTPSRRHSLTAAITAAFSTLTTSFTNSFTPTKTKQLASTIPITTENTVFENKHIKTYQTISPIRALSFPSTALFSSATYTAPTDILPEYTSPLSSLGMLPSPIKEKKLIFE